jgi:hypothetical protein
MIKIGIGKRTLSSDEIWSMGWRLINAATQLDRYQIQLAQSRADPTSEKERNEADKAASRALAAGRKVRKLIEGLRE